MAGFGERAQRRWLVNVEFEQSLNTKLLLVCNTSVAVRGHVHGCCASFGLERVGNASVARQCVSIRAVITHQAASNANTKQILNRMSQESKPVQ